MRLNAQFVVLVAYLKILMVVVCIKSISMDLHPAALG